MGMAAREADFWELSFMDPTLHGNENAGSENEAQMDDARKARRRLLKLGAASAPLVLTFKPSSAWAVSAGCIMHEGKRETPGNLYKIDNRFRRMVRHDNGLTYRFRKGRWKYWFNGNGQWRRGLYDLNRGPYRHWNHYQEIYMNKGPGSEVHAGNVNHQKLRALVYNDNVGWSCVSSIIQS